MSRDARKIDAPPRDAPRAEPQHWRVRIRIGGVWYPGAVQRWARLSDGSWAVWLCWQTDPEHPTIAPEWAWFAWDPEAIERV